MISTIKTAQKLSNKYAQTPLVTSVGILLEIGNALTRHYKKESIQIIEYFLTSQGVEIIYLDSVLLKRAFEFYKKYQDKKWSLVDCFSFVIMNDLKIQEALTCDRHFEQAGFKALLAQ